MLTSMFSAGPDPAASACDIAPVSPKRATKTRAIPVEDEEPTLEELVGTKKPASGRVGRVQRTRSSKSSTRPGSTGDLSKMRKASKSPVRGGGLSRNNSSRSLSRNNSSRSLKGDGSGRGNLSRAGSNRSLGSNCILDMSFEAVGGVIDMVGRKSNNDSKRNMQEHMDEIEAFVKVVKGAKKADREKMLEEAILSQATKGKSKKQSSS